MPAPQAPAAPTSAPAPQPAGAPLWGTPAPAPAAAAPLWGTPAPAAAAPQWGAPAPAAAAPQWGAPAPAPQPAAPLWGTPAAPGTPGAGVPTPLPIAWAPAKAKILQFGAAAQAASGTHGLRTSIAAAAIMVGVLLSANVINAAMPLPGTPQVVNTGPQVPQNPGQPGTPANPANPGPIAAGDTVDLGNGVTVRPPKGWSVAGQDQGMVGFSKGDVIVIAAGLVWKNSAVDLATQYRDSWFKQGQFTGEDPQTGTINGSDGAVLNYTGTVKGQQLDGGIVALVKGGKAGLLNMFGPSGSLKDVSGDLNDFINSMQIGG
jgi:hypothetical protein